MTYNQFQQEVSHIWNTSTDAGFPTQLVDDTVERHLHNYSWEIGKMEIQGKSKQEQVAFAWKKFKEDYPQLIK